MLAVGKWNKNDAFVTNLKKRNTDISEKSMIAKIDTSEYRDFIK